MVHPFEPMTERAARHTQIGCRFSDAVYRRLAGVFVQLEQRTVQLVIPRPVPPKKYTSSHYDASCVLNCAGQTA